MGKSIEIMARLHAAKTTQWESASGRSGLTADILNGAIALAEKDNFIGTCIVKAKYLDDFPALTKLYSIMEKLVEQSDVQERIKPALADLLYRVILERPLKPQHKKITSAWLRFGIRSNRAKKNIDGHKKAIKSLEKAQLRKTAESDIQYLKSQIESLNQRIVRERADLRVYAEQKAESTIACPKCRALGTHRNAPCNVCDGRGIFRQTSDHMFNHFRHSDARIDRVYFSVSVYPLVELLLKEFYGRESDVILAMDNNLKLERIV